ncbi:MAG: hypothetical protein ACOC6F_03600, partial [bacterium]
MRSATELAQRLTRLVWSKSSTTFFLNGAPGSGKSQLLQKLAGGLPDQIPRSYVLGPYALEQEDSVNLERYIMRDCQSAGFLDSQLDEGATVDPVAAWRWFADNAYVSTEHTFLILIDVVAGNRIDLARLGNLFSRARRLEGNWSHRRIRLFHMFAGYWDHPGLEQHFRDIGTSFPYTPGDNYAVWSGVSRSEVARLVRSALPADADSVYDSAVFELTDGHPAAALDVLREVDPENVSMGSLRSATRRAALRGPAGEALVAAWLLLSPAIRLVLKDLVLRRHLPIRLLTDRWRQLAVAGAVREHRVGESHYVTFKSWYAELLARLNAKGLGIATSGTRRVQTNDVMPPITELNVEAYRVINDIENQARNFVATHLYLRQTSGHILQGRDRRFNEDSGKFDDAYQRASDWRQRSLDKGVLNPLLAYLSTRDLAH